MLNDRVIDQEKKDITPVEDIFMIKNRKKRSRKYYFEIYEEEETAPDGYFTSDEGNLIPSEWEQLYHFVKFGKAPAEWRKTFEDDDEVGTVDTVAAGYLQPISGGRP